MFIDAYARHFRREKAQTLIGLLTVTYDSAGGHRVKSITEMAESAMNSVTELLGEEWWERQSEFAPRRLLLRWPFAGRAAIPVRAKCAE